MSTASELFWYIFSHIMSIVAVSFVYIGVEQLKKDGYLYKDFPDFQRNHLTVSSK